MASKQDSEFEGAYPADWYEIQAIHEAADAVIIEWIHLALHVVDATVQDPIYPQ